jgi:hypothetical protein
VRRSRLGFSFPGCIVALALAGCSTIGDSTVPIATLEFPAIAAPSGRSLVIVLPGRDDDAEEMKDEGLPQAIQTAWPEADVLLTSATLAYYRDGNLVQRLHREIVEPAREHYARVWMAGASLGGMGVLLYEREHPGELTGIVLLAPFLGNTDLLEEIRNAGGPRKWEPGPLPDRVNGALYQRQVWKMVKEWGDRPQLAKRVWLAVGTRDRFVEGARLLKEELPVTHYLELPGRHNWALWRAAASRIFARIKDGTRPRR